ncbi:MAG: D-glycero-beta-D-manno-heptose-7-phosphate kinase [Nanoarchaeota archaeon]
MKNRFIEILSKFKSKKILVIGDIMLDKYVFGEVNRISQEAPVKIVNVKSERYVLGGAANSANNITSLNALAILIGIVGNDDAQKKLYKELKKNKIDNRTIVKDNTRPTTQKTRILAQNQQLIRIDREEDKKISPQIEKKLIRIINSNINKVDGVVLCDYNKGVVTKNLVNNITRLTKTKKLIFIVDPKPNHKDYYKNVSLITPNHQEACLMLNMNPSNGNDIKGVGSTLRKELDSNILITRGKKGATLFEKNGEITDIPTVAKEVYDVSGAGDTVTSTIILALTSGASLKEAAILANHAAGIVVGKVGTETLTINEIKNSIEDE